MLYPSWMDDEDELKALASTMPKEKTISLEGIFSQPKEEPEEEDGILKYGENVINLAGSVPILLGSAAAETAGDILKTVGDAHSSTFGGKETTASTILNSAGDFANMIGGDLANRAAEHFPAFKTSPVPEEDTFFKSINTFLSGFAGVNEGLAGMIHADKTAEALARIREKTSIPDDQRPAPDFSLDYILDGLPIDLGQLGGSMAGIVELARFLPPAAVPVASRTLGVDALLKFLINRGNYTAAKNVANVAAQSLPYGLISAPTESLSEGGNERRDLLRQGYSEEEATEASAITALKNFPLLLGSNTFEGAAMFSPILKLGSEKAISTVAQILARMGFSSFLEANEEAAQKAITNEIEGKPFGYTPFGWADDQWDEAKHVIGPSALLAGLGGTYQAYQNRKGNEAIRGGGQGSQENISQPQPQTNNEIAEPEAKIKGLKEQAQVQKEKAGKAKVLGDEETLTEAKRKGNNLNQQIEESKKQLEQLKSQQPAQPQTQEQPAQKESESPEQQPAQPQAQPEAQPQVQEQAAEQPQIQTQPEVETASTEEQSKDTPIFTPPNIVEFPHTDENGRKFRYEVVPQEGEVPFRTIKVYEDEAKETPEKSSEAERITPSEESSETEKESKPAESPAKDTAEEKTQQEPAPKQDKENYGRTATAVTDSKNKYPVRYKVVEAETLSTSHTIEGLGVVPNENYTGVQPRDRVRVDQQAQILKTANKFDPDLALDTAMSVNDGAPITLNDGTVLNGNRRAMAIVYNYKNTKNGRGELYRNALIENAETFGLNADEVSKMKHPVLVREIAKDLTEDEKNDIADTTSGGSGVSPSEQAKSDAKKLPSDLFQSIPEGTVINFRTQPLTAISRNFLTDVLHAVESTDAASGYTVGKGTISKRGVERAENAIVAYTYESDKLTYLTAEALDNNIRTICNALVGAAPNIFRVKMAMKNGAAHKYDLSDIAQAVEKFAALQKQGQKVRDYLNTFELGEASLSDEAKEILSFLDNNNRSEKKITAFLNGIAQGIQAQGNLKQGSFFGSSEPAALMDIIQQAKHIAATNEPIRINAPVETAAPVETTQAAPDNQASLFSKQGNGDTTIADFVADEDLTPLQKLLKSFGKMLGVQVEFFRNKNGDFHGAHTNGVTYINVNSNMPLGKVFWHETLHWMKNNNPKLYQQLVKAAGITDAQRKAYLKETGRTDLKTDDEINEEILCDMMEDTAKRTGLLQSIAGKNRGLIERVIQWLKDTMNKFIDHFRNPSGKLTTKQAQALADEFGKIAKDLVDPNGDKIFRYNNRTHNIELADGRDTSEEHLTDMAWMNHHFPAKFAFAGKKAKTANLELLKRAKKMDERGADRDRIYKDTGWFKGKDGKWRFEIPDNRNQMNLHRLIEKGNFGKPTPLEEIYDNPALFAAYPKLRGITTKAVDPSDDGIEADLVRGSDAATYGNSIFFNMDRLFDDMDEVEKTLVHELQHVIQGYEKFSSGGNYEQIKDILENNKDMIMRAVDKIPDGKRYFDAIFAVKKAMKRGNEQAEAKARKEMTQARQNLSTTDRKDIETFAERFYELSRVDTRSKKAKIAAYYRLGGEQESRHVEERLDNREGMPVAHDEDALIVFGGKTYPIKKIASENGEGELVEGSIPRSAATANGTTNTVRTNVSTGSNNKGGVSSNANVETNSPSESISQGEGEIKYSIGNSNSSESLTQKIRNKVSSWLDGKRPNERRGKRITDNLRKLSKHRILYGNVEGADDIVVDHMQQLIQSRRAYDWEKLLPVVGKEIAKNLKLNPTSEQSNYIADWLLTGALNNTSPEAKLFQKAMRDNPAMAEILQETRDLFQEFADMSASERVGSSIVNQQGKSFLERLGAIKDNFNEQVLDDLSPLQEVVDKAIKDAPPALAEFIKRNVNPKQLAQLSRGKGSIAELMVNGKTSDIEKIRLSLSEQYPGVRFDNFKPITAIIESVDGDWKGLQTFAVAKLSKEMHEYNRAHPELTEPLTPYTSEADADAIIKQGEKKFGEAQQDLVRFSKTLLAMEHDSGLITDKTFYRLLKSWKHYVPMAQVFDENEDYTKLDHLKRRKGHLGDTWSPIQIMMANAHKRIQACERNKVKLELATLVRFGNFDSNLSEVASSNPDADNIIRFRENGKIKYLETPDPAIKRAVESLQSKSDGAWITKALRAITGFMRMRLTGGNLDFAAGNMFRDLPDAYIHNDQLGKNVFVIGDLMRAWGSAVKEVGLAALGKGQSRDLIDWKMSGGAQAAFVSEDVDYIQRSIDDATSTRWQRYKKKPLLQLLDDMQKFAEFTESVTRLTTYKLAKAKLDKSGADTLTSKQLAALAAREASVDFAKAGSSTRKVNQVVLFTNAAIQSLNLWVEAGKAAAKGNTKPLFGKLFRAVAHGVFFAALQAAFASMGGDDDKEAYEQTQSWEKETYWIRANEPLQHLQAHKRKARRL